MSGICSMCGKCCMYVPYLLRNVPNAKQERCPYLLGELGNTKCMIYYEDYRIGLEVAEHVFCMPRIMGGDIEGCTYFYDEPKINETINKVKTI